MSRAYLARHRGSSNWGDWKSNQLNRNQIKSNQILGKTEIPPKTSLTRVENQQTQPTYDV